MHKVKDLEGRLEEEVGRADAAETRAAARFSLKTNGDAPAADEGGGGKGGGGGGLHKKSSSASRRGEDPRDPLVFPPIASRASRSR